MNGVLQIRMALDGIVENEQIVVLINRYLGLQMADKLTAIKEEDKLQLESFPQNPRGENSDQRERRNE